MIEYLREKIRSLASVDFKKMLSAWGWIYRYVRKYWAQIVAYIALGLFGTGFGLLSTVVSKNLIDAVTGHPTTPIGWALGFYVGLGVSQIFIQAITGKISLLIHTKVQQEIQGDVFDRIMSTDWESLEEYTVGDLLVRASQDTSAVASSVLNFVPTAILATANFIGAFVIVCYHDPIMAVLALMGAPVMMLSSRYRLKNMKQFQRESQKMSSRKITFDQQTFQNIQPIKAFDLVSSFSNKMRKLQRDMLDLGIRQYHYQAVTNIITSLTAMAVGYACYGFAIYRLWQGEITFGTMTLFLSLSGTLSNSFRNVVGLIPMAIRAAVSAERVQELIDLPDECYEERDQAWALRDAAKESGIYIRAEDVGFTYRDGKAVYHNSYMEANPGEIIGLMGPSGEGKTTTMRLLLGVLHPLSGRLLCGTPGGKSMDISPSTRCLFSYVPQGNTMFSGTIADNLRLVKEQASDEELIHVLKQACAWEFVSKLSDGMYTNLGERGQGLSEGQNQRLAIARALLADAPVLLLDEATSALDMDMEQQVIANIIRWDPRKTIIVAAHRPSIFPLCTRVYRVGDDTIQLLSKEKQE